MKQQLKYLYLGFALFSASAFARNEVVSFSSSFLYEAVQNKAQIEFTVKDISGRPKRNFCLSPKSDDGNYLIDESRVCTNRKGVGVFHLSANFSGLARVYLAQSRRDMLTEVASTFVYFYDPFSAPASSVTIYKNSCINIAPSGGVPIGIENGYSNYAYKLIFDGTSGSISEFGDYCGGLNSIGNAQVEVSDAIGNKALVNISIVSSPPGDITISFDNSRPIVPGECISLYAYGNGGEWFYMISDPTQGNLFNFGYREAQFCAGSGSGTVVIMAQDMDGMTAYANIIVQGEDVPPPEQN